MGIACLRFPLRRIFRNAVSSTAASYKPAVRRFIGERGPLEYTWTVRRGPLFYRPPPVFYPDIVAVRFVNSYNTHAIFSFD